jgi:hypothetical protein
MGRLFAKTYFKWREPKLVHRAKLTLEARSLSPWFRPIAVLTMVGCSLIPWFVVRMNPNKEPAPLGVVLLVSLGGALATVSFFIPWLLWLCSPLIVVSERGITRILGNCAGELTYKDIWCGEITSQVFDGERIAVLAITTEKRTVTFGIDKAVPLGELQGVLSQHGVPTTVTASLTSSTSSPAGDLAQGP